jgi:steroid delta-isomerase-like uncharacterized protein
MAGAVLASAPPSTVDHRHDGRRYRPPDLRTRSESMATTEVEQLLERWPVAWSSHDPERVLALFADDCVFEDVTFAVVSRGREELRGFVGGVFAAIPDVSFEVTSRLVDGRRAALEWVMAGTHRGDLPGMAATGERFSVRGSTILELGAGAIRRESDSWDAATVMKQVGLLPPG